MSRREALPPIDGLYSLKVDNLSYGTSVHDLRRLFERYGDIGDVHIPRDRRTNQSRGFGFVRFYDRKDAEHAASRNDGRRVNGRDLRVTLAKYDRPVDERARDRRSHRRSRSPPPRRSRSHSRDSVRDCSRDRSRSRSRLRTRSPVVKRDRASRSRSRAKSASRSRSPVYSKSASRSRSRSRSHSNHSRSPAKKSPKSDH